MDFLWPSVPPLGEVGDGIEPQNVGLPCFDCLDAPDLTLLAPLEVGDARATPLLCLPSMDTTSSLAPAPSSSFDSFGRQMRVPLSSLTLADMRLFQEHNALGKLLYSESLPMEQRSKLAAHPIDSKLQQVEGGASTGDMEWAAPESSCNDEQLLQRVLRQQDTRQLGLYASGSWKLDSMAGGPEDCSTSFACMPFPQPLASATNSQAHAPANFAAATSSLHQPTTLPGAQYHPAPAHPPTMSHPLVPVPPTGGLAADAAPAPLSAVPLTGGLATGVALAAPTAMPPMGGLATDVVVPAAPHAAGAEGAFAALRPQAATKHPSPRKRVVPVRHQQVASKKEPDELEHPSNGAAAAAAAAAAEGPAGMESEHVPWVAAADAGYAAVLDEGNVDVSATITALSSVGVGGAHKAGPAGCKGASGGPGDQRAAQGAPMKAEGDGGREGAGKGSAGGGGSDQEQGGSGGGGGGAGGHGFTGNWKGGPSPVKPTQGGGGGGDGEDESGAGGGAGRDPNARNRYADAVNQALEISLPGLMTPAPATASECAMIMAEVNERVSKFAVGLVNNLLECLTSLGYGDEAALAMAEGNLGQLSSFEAHPFKMVLRFSQCYLEAYIAHAMKEKRSKGAAATTKEGIQASLALSTDVGPRILELHSQQLRSCALDLWALMHIMDPRPDGTLKDNLAAYTRRTRKQVTDWFTNWRARHWKTVVRGIGVSLDQSDASGNDGAPHAASEED